MDGVKNIGVTALRLDDAHTLAERRAAALSALREIALETLPQRLWEAALRVARPRFLLQWYGLAGFDHERTLNRAWARRIVGEVGVDLQHMLSDVAGTAPDLKQCYVAEVARPLAQSYHQRLHYLASPRPQGRHLGLLDRGALLLFLATYNHCDLAHILSRLPVMLHRDEVLVLSRLVAHPVAPRNCASHALARFRTHVRRRYPAVRLIVSYHDPNIFEHGAIYSATNARLLGVEPLSGYLYVDHRYATRRALIERFGTSDPTALSRSLGGRLRLTRVPLEPLRVYAWSLDPNLDLRHWKESTFVPDARLVGKRRPSA